MYPVLAWGEWRGLWWSQVFPAVIPSHGNSHLTFVIKTQPRPALTLYNTSLATLFFRTKIKPKSTSPDLLGPRASLSTDNTFSNGNSLVGMSQISEELNWLNWQRHRKYFWRKTIINIAALTSSSAWKNWQILRSNSP